jgi:DNA invertase Pin-like site-specific DNA recombinase
MSTEHQNYSIDNQREAIREFADSLGYDIVATYEDSGRSGLNLGGRAGLQRLLADVEGGRADFEVVVVYDVSRWGRFQNIDESASYEFRCDVAGVRIEYCAEQFANDGSIGSDVLKSIKRSMAAEHSRVLSVKVFAGQSRLSGLGYRQGGPPGFGLRRFLIDLHGTPKGELARNEHKSIQTDRVILVPGPKAEIEIVQSIYREFVDGERSEAEIARSLNQRNVVTDLGRPWTRGTIHQVLINEKYIGNNVWNRGSFKLKRRRVRNDPSIWIRADDVFEAIVDKAVFYRAQAIIQARSERLSDDEMLTLLADLARHHGSLSGLVIDEADGCPSSSAYQHRFGSLLRAYMLIGYTPARDYRYIETNRFLRSLYPNLISEIVSKIELTGGSVICDRVTDLLTINSEFTASLVIARCSKTAGGAFRWKVRFDTSLHPDITIAIRMEPNNRQVLDYYLLPRLDFPVDRVRMAEENGLHLDAYRTSSLDQFLELTARTNIRRAA